MTDHPALIYATLVIGIILVVAQAVPKILGPIGKALEEWTTRRRESRIATRSADIIDLQRQMEYLTEQRRLDRENTDQERVRAAKEYADLKAEFADYRRMWAEREARWRIEWQSHRNWDYRALEALIGREPPFDPSPPFMTPDPPEALPERTYND